MTMNEPDRWLGVEIRHLAALHAVAEQGSFGAAAHHLGYTQSAISQQIATLEKVVGQKLVDRPGGPRKVSMTEAGDLLLRHAQAIVARLAAAQADLAALAEGESGTLRIGTFQSVGNRMVPTLVRRFHDAWPKVSIRLTESHDDDDTLQMVEAGELDLAFTVLPIPEGPFDAVALMRDPYLLVVAADSPFASREKPVTMRDLEGEPIISYRYCRATTQIEQHLGSRGTELDVVFRSDDNGTVQAMVAAGMGAAIMPALAMDHNDREVVALQTTPPFPARIIALAWHRDRYRSPAATAFVELAQTLAADMSAASLAAAAA
jgi:DNA-binding transcriptional LysR family regulator